MQERTDRPPERPTPTPLQPSHIRQALTVMADELERTSNRRRLLAEVGLRRAFTAALGTLPAEVANAVGDRVTELLPDSGPVITHGAYAVLLRQVAEGVGPTPVAEDQGASAAELQARAAADYADAQGRREQLSGEDRFHGNENGRHA